MYPGADSNISSRRKFILNEREPREMLHLLFSDKPLNQSNDSPSVGSSIPEKPPRQIPDCSAQLGTDLYAQPSESCRSKISIFFGPYS